MLCSWRHGRIPGIQSTNACASGQAHLTILDSFLSSRPIQRWRFWTDRTFQHALKRLLRKCKQAGIMKGILTGNATHEGVCGRHLSTLIWATRGHPAASDMPERPEYIHQRE